jgi:membrane-bound lytic murein transglycosylase D
MVACRRPHALALLAALCARPALAVVEPAPPIDEDAKAFPAPPIVRKQVRFWEKVFAKYPSTTVIVHESIDPDRIIDVIDYRSFAKGGSDEPVPRKERDAVTTRYLRRYTKAIDRFKRFQENAVKFGPIEKRVWNVYKSSPAAVAKLFSGDIKLRAQTGLADDFKRASGVAAAYLPYMEKVFAQYGVPTRLTRLPFVESMFNMKARSKVGASGLWQFMPATAKLFIYVNGMVDERNSPFKATRAAAQLLGLNYRELRSWPLAITAYNHGAVGMQRAARQVGTDDIGEIIKRYQSPSFGFASRNFYGEFLAASNAFERLQRSGKLKKTESVPEIESIILEKPLSVRQLLDHTPITRQILSDHNPCLLDTSFTKYADKALPPFYEIKIPRGMVQATKAALIELREKRYARR